MYVLYLQDLGRASNKAREGGVKGNCASSVSSPSCVRDETENVSDRSGHAIANRSAQARRLLDERARDLLDTLVDARNLRLQLRQPAAVARIRPAVQRDHLSRTFRMFRCRMLLRRQLKPGKLLDDSAQFFLDRQQPRVEVFGRNPCVLYCHFFTFPHQLWLPSFSLGFYLRPLMDIRSRRRLDRPEARTSERLRSRMLLARTLLEPS